MGTVGLLVNGMEKQGRGIVVEDVAAERVSGRYVEDGLDCVGLGSGGMLDGSCNGEGAMYGGNGATGIIAEKRVRRSGFT